MLAALKNVFSIPSDQPELVVAQYSAFRKQVPLLYVMLVANTLALSLTHIVAAPLWLAVGVPMAFYVICFVRVVHWLRQRNVVISPEEAAAGLRSTTLLSIALGFAFCGWALSLYGYGDQLHDSHIAFYIGVTIIGCMFCLMHLRAAAFILGIVVLTPFALFFLMTGVVVFQAIAINLLLVIATVIYVLNANFRDFSQLIDSRRKVLQKQQDMQRLLAENQKLANSDSLTGLANRRWFLAQLDIELEKAQTSGGRLAVGIFDLDGFKPVNDAYGHAAGDKVLIEVARRLENHCGNAVHIARLGGDEFGFIVTNAPADATLQENVAEVIQQLSQPIHLPGVAARVGASAGFAVFPDGGQAAQELFERAAHALYHAKQAGRGTCVLFTRALATEIAYRSLVEQELRAADLDKEMSVVFQPLWSVRANGIYGFEALARWTTPALGSVRPDIFIAVAERCGLMGGLSEVMFRKALVEAERWPSHLLLSFNLSAKDISSTQTLTRLLTILEESRFDPHRLILELTETAMLENLNEAFRNLERIRELGIGIALDDFGVGQSSLGQVHRLPISKIKIDQSFVREIDSNGVARNIVRTIMDLARNLDCTCIVEGIETAEQANILSSLGCELMQGYYFGRPLEPTAALERVQSSEQAKPALKAIG
ncbi:putative bifunctional diguanylate cyclase/phosphodiesterase [Rhizobium alvei]|uniref:putative bifunctional diguanylate cyclase/phosphodiesterase n=1 Tax=Rhizobium alvei TaxID=1132659 RepID=UPI00360705ED